MTVDQQLQEWAREQRSCAPAIDVPIERFGSGRRLRGRVVAVAAAVVGIGALAVALVAVRSSGGGQSTAPDRPRPAPRGYANVTFHGLTVTAPTSWVGGGMTCGVATANTVAVLDGPIAACRPFVPRPVTSVVFSTALKATAPQLAGPVRHAIRIDGVAATRVTGTKPGYTVVDVFVPSLAAEVTITSPSPAEAERLAGTLQISNADGNGCPARQAAMPLDQRRGDGPGNTLVAGHPMAVVACNYLGAFLESSHSLSVAETVATLNALPEGLSEARSGSHSAAACSVGRDVTTDTDDGSSVTLRFRYPDGSVRQVWVRYGFCGKLGATNGARTGQATMRLWDYLGDAGVDPGVLPSGLHPVR